MEECEGREITNGMGLGGRDKGAGGGRGRRIRSQRTGFYFKVGY